MSSPQYNWFQAMTASQFDPGSLSSSFQPVFTNGFPVDIKILTVFNGAAVAMDYSFDGVNQHGTWPAGATLIVDLQANHRDVPPHGGGTLNGKVGQNVWVRTAVNPTFLTIGGFR